MELLPQGIDRRLSNDLNQCPRFFSAFPRGAWSGRNSVSGMFDMPQLVGEVGKKQLLRMQERRYLSLRKVSIPSLDDKLKLVGHSGCEIQDEDRRNTVRARTGSNRHPLQLTVR